MSSHVAREAGAEAAEAVRSLNHAALGPPTAGTAGRGDLADVYAVVGELRLLAERLPQALDQAARTLERPRLVNDTDNNSDPARAVAATLAALHRAGQTADTLAGQLADAHETLSHLYVTRQLSVFDVEAGE